MKIKWMALAVVCLALAGQARAQTPPTGGVRGTDTGTDRTPTSGTRGEDASGAARGGTMGDDMSTGVQLSTGTGGVYRSTSTADMYRSTSTDVRQSTSGARGYEPRGGAGTTGEQTEESSRPGRQGP